MSNPIDIVPQIPSVVITGLVGWILLQVYQMNKQMGKLEQKLDDMKEAFNLYRTNRRQ
jgi:hypothetical protein